MDSKTSREVIDFLKEIHRAGNTIILITHDNGIAAEAERILRIHDGRIVYDGTPDGDDVIRAHKRIQKEGTSWD